MNEIVHYFADKKNGVIVDATFGCGGHACALSDALNNQVRIIALDQDQAALERSKALCEPYKGVIEFYRANFREIDTILEKIGINAVDGFIFDIGVSKNQLIDAQRGFSFMQDGPLDMRMDDRNLISARDIVNTYDEKQLADIIYRYGEERKSRAIARAIVHERKNAEIITTKHLADVIKRAYRIRYHVRIHPATRTFQALRIAVNRELEVLEEGLAHAFNYAASEALIAVITFHSLEDRIVKHTFRAWAHDGAVEVLTKKPITPSAEEIADNPHARSAKLRIAKRSLQA